MHYNYRLYVYSWVYCKLESYVHFLVPDNTIVLRFPDNIRHCLYTFYLGGIHPTRSWFSESQASHLLPMKFLRWDFGFRKNYFPNQKGFVLMCFPVWCYFHFYTSDRSIRIQKQVTLLTTTLPTF